MCAFAKSALANKSIAALKLRFDAGIRADRGLIEGVGILIVAIEQIGDARR